jgi:type VI secretion system protein ImpF
MAELAPRERLQPSLLERLTDDDPHSQQEGREKRVLSPARLRESVGRDLGWLFNTVNLAVMHDLTNYPEVARSVVNYGMTDLTGRTASSLDLPVLERQLAKTIWDFEPRLLRSSVKVRVVANREAVGHNALAFDIEAELWAQPLPLRLFFRTEIDLEVGAVSVMEKTRTPP